MMRPPPGGTPAHKARTSAPQAERITNNSSRGIIGRSTITTGAAAGAAAAAAGAPPAAGAAGCRGGRRRLRPQARCRKPLKLWPCSSRGIPAQARRQSERLRTPSDNRRGKRCGSRRSAHWSASWLPSSLRGRLWLGRGRLRLRRRSRRGLGSGCCWLGLGCGGSLDRAYCALAARRQARHVLGETLQAASPPGSRWSNAPCNRSGRPT